MELIARLVVEGFISGLHKSPYHGFSVEFAEHRQYMPGDEIRYIDWKVYGKSDKFYIKEYEEETNLKSYIILDRSSSMGYSSGPISKLEYGSYLAASLSHLMLRQRDAVGLIAFDENITHFIPPRGNTLHIHNILKELGEISPGGETDTLAVFGALAERIKRRGLIIIISDFLDDPDTVLLGLKHFRHRKHEVIAFHLLDKDELVFPFRSHILFKDLETGRSLVAHAQTLQEAYLKELREFTDRLRKECRQRGIDYLQIDTSTPLDKALLSYLIKRRELG
jgi:uncharacterized protein (DUF58 family)